jgi:hypothetical protein
MPLHVIPLGTFPLELRTRNLEWLSSYLRSMKIQLLEKPNTEEALINLADREPRWISPSILFFAKKEFKIKS